MNSIVSTSTDTARHNDSIAVHSDLSEENTWKLQAGFLLLQDPTTLQELGIAGFGPVTDQAYDPIRTIAQVLGIDLQNA